MPRLLPGLWLILLLASMPFARAEVAPEAVSRGREAVGEFALRVPADATVAQLPRLADPGAAPMLNAIWNSGPVVAGRPQPAAGAADLQRWADGAARVLRAYLTAFSAGGASEAEAGRRMLAFQDETSRGFVFLLRIATTLQTAAQDSVAHLPPAQRLAGRAQIEEGMARMGAGIGQIGLGILAQLNGTGLRVENARLLATALAEDVPLIRPVLPAAMRQALREAASTVSRNQRDDATRAQLQRVRQALAE